MSETQINNNEGQAESSNTNLDDANEVLIKEKRVYNYKKIFSIILVGVLLLVASLLVVGLLMKDDSVPEEIVPLMSFEGLNETGHLTSERQEQEIYNQELYQEIHLVLTGKSSEELGRFYAQRATGLTLYFLEQGDCGLACQQEWVPFTNDTEVSLGKLKTIQNTEGSYQYSWDNRLLYLFSGDEKPGDVNGLDSEYGFSVLKIEQF
ncbi:hypothetical protein KC851_02735 [Candidatus Kaiserbacteria bacterium]|nr:hypothetical protein [Candidatus Kaiserbacteria bacterium]